MTSVFQSFPRHDRYTPPNNFQVSPEFLGTRVQWYPAHAVSQWLTGKTRRHIVVVARADSYPKSSLGLLRAALGSEASVADQSQQAGAQ